MDDFASDVRCFLGILSPMDLSEDVNGRCSNLCSSDEVSSPEIQGEARSCVTVREVRKDYNTGSIEHFASTPRCLPCGKIVRVADSVLCRILLGHCL